MQTIASTFPFSSDSQRQLYRGYQSSSPEVLESDFLVIGSGIAGLSFALRVADHGKVSIVTKDVASEGSTRYAQGGVCAVLAANDSVESHASDTMVAGDYLCDPEVVNLVCAEGTEAVLDLVRLGAEFDTNEDGTLHLVREGGHEHRRIVHAADLTGKEIERALLEKAHSHPNISFFENHLATELVTSQVHDEVRCKGIEVIDRSSGKSLVFLAGSTLLATGGAGHVYPNTTNPPVATGDGIAIAARANAVISNMEFVQFHPTSLYLDERFPKRTNAFLITEAVRGDGGILLNSDMQRFMPEYDSREELAPRDVVARAIDHQMKSRGDSCVFLDISHKPREEILKHFPNIAAECLEYGIDITKDPIPVVPACHYTCGGIKTGLQGETSLAGLFACGEAACTGLHGANRLASNSLLEGLVFANRSAAACVERKAALGDEDLSSWYGSSCVSDLDASAEQEEADDEQQTEEATALLKLAELRKELQNVMWDGAGIVRSDKVLIEALCKIKSVSTTVEGILGSTTVRSAQALLEANELRNLLTISELVVVSALQRKESRGLHYNTDYPAKLESEKHDTDLTLPTDLRSYLEREDVYSQNAAEGPHQRGMETRRKSASPAKSPKSHKDLMPVMKVRKDPEL